MFRILSYNIWGLPFTPERISRIETIADRLIGLNADIVSLQEAWLETDRKTLRKKLEASDLAYNCYFPSSWLGSGLMIFSRYPIVRTDFLPYRLNSRPQELSHGDYYGGKGVAFAQLDTPEGRVDVYNTHTIAQYAADQDDMYLAHRMAQLYELTRFIHTNSSGALVIAAGDYNIRPDQFGYQLVKNIGQLIDVVEALSTEPDYTYSAENPYVDRTATPRRVDYVFVQGFEPLHTEVVMKPAENSTGLSDHFGVLAEVEPGSVSAPPAAEPELEPVLGQLLRILDEGLKAARMQRTRHWSFAGLGAASFLGLNALASTVQTRREFLKRAIRLGGGGAAFITLVANGWLSTSVFPDEIADLVEIKRRVQRQYDTVKQDEGNKWLMNEFQQTINLDTIYYKQPSDGYSERDLTSGSLKLLNWNIERGYDPEAIADCIASRDPDIVCLQEVDWNNARTDNIDVLQVIADRTGLVGLFGTEFLEIESPNRKPRTAGGGVHGNAILTRYKPVSVTRIVLPTTFDWQNPPPSQQAIARREPRIGGRIATCAEFSVDGRRLFVSSVHLEDKAGGVEGRFAQFSHLVEVIDKQAQSNDISVIAGDLNTLQNWFTTLVGYEDASRSLGKPWRTSECTWWKTELLKETGYRDPFSCSDWTIDHISLYREKLDWILCRGAEVTAKHIGDFNTSDHRPIEVVLEIP